MCQCRAPCGSLVHPDDPASKGNRKKIMESASHHQSRSDGTKLAIQANCFNIFAVKKKPTSQTGYHTACGRHAKSILSFPLELRASSCAMGNLLSNIHASPMRYLYNHWNARMKEKYNQSGGCNFQIWTSFGFQFAWCTQNSIQQHEQCKSVLLFFSCFCVF